MNHGLSISASGALTALYRQDLLAGNLANLDTIGFKPDIAITRQRDPVRLEDNLPAWPSNDLLERLGGGAQLAPNRVAFRQGVLRATGNPLDVAVEGEGFLVVRVAGSGTTDRVRLTRDGRLALDGRGRLVTAASGLPVLDTGNREIRLTESGSISIAPDGTVKQGDTAVAQLALARVSDLRSLRKDGPGLFVQDATAAASRTRASGRIVQGSVEESSVDEIRVLMQIQDAAQAAQANIGLMTYHDRIMDQAINRLGRVA
ncbi:MAG: flagellar hook basal-body protein [Leptolyngbya sp. PLA2]|nr:flagellar hook basal-body protein [Leptolyngbya sp.]MCE7972665.1 flagellar hook basal-body protein [Leptolyngbya sp. PL-A2]MCQ3939529.1 hypothetical protein [cyanobacterium CYA1]MCZ7632214.1 flagellar hook basal-body protein [Phycisphaerales bacterium]MDL1903786.1 flagellar hook basal-body protein [Synechococcales cyanobacterium CNB]GIK18513.1 MAG: flagellar basal body protein [Planctomycetota bacterium]